MFVINGFLLFLNVHFFHFVAQFMTSTQFLPSVLLSTILTKRLRNVTRFAKMRCSSLYISIATGITENFLFWYIFTEKKPAKNIHYWLYKELKAPFFTGNMWNLLILYHYCWELLILADNCSVVSDNWCWFWYLLRFLLGVQISIDTCIYWDLLLALKIANIY